MLPYLYNKNDIGDNAYAVEQSYHSSNLNSFRKLVDKVLDESIWL